VKVTEAQLREAYQGIMARGRGDRGACPAPEAVLALARREGAEAGRLATLDHVMSCRDCRAELDLLRSLEAAGAQGGAGAAASGRRWMVPTALAATLLVAVGLGRLVLRNDDDTVRSGPGSAARVELVAPGAEVTAGAPVAFTWHPVPGAARYRLEVLTDTGDLAIEAETHDTTLLSGAAARLLPGSYQWWVIALTPGPGARSDMRRLRVTAQ
jgi:hypothetical protein